LSGAPDIWLRFERFSAFDCSNRLTAANATKPQKIRPANRR
jgi:hypothetical protein